MCVSMREHFSNSDLPHGSDVSPHRHIKEGGDAVNKGSSHPEIQYVDHDSFEEIDDQFPVIGTARALYSFERKHRSLGFVTVVFLCCYFMMLCEYIQMHQMMRVLLPPLRRLCLVNT